MTGTLETSLQFRSESQPARKARKPSAADGRHELDPDRLPDHIDRLYRTAWALCGSPQDAEDLVQDTLANVLKRTRLLRDNNELGYLLRALRNTYVNGLRAAARRPQTRELLEEDAPSRHESGVRAHEIMAAIAGAPAFYRDAVIAVDVLGMSYREAAGTLRVPEATVTTRLHRGRQRVAQQLMGEAARVSS